MPMKALLLALLLAGGAALAQESPKASKPTQEQDKSAKDPALAQCEANLTTLEDRVMVEMAESGRWKAAYAETLAQLRKLQREKPPVP